MFNTISWHGYWIAIALITTLYYVLILVLFYLQDLKTWFAQKTALTSTPIFQQAGFQDQMRHPSFQTDPDFQTPPPNTDEHTVYACMDELTAFFEAAKSRKWRQETLLNALHGILSKYPGLKDSEYNQSMGNVIISQSEHYCSIHLKAEDLDNLWL